VIAEMTTLNVLFKGDSNLDMIRKISRVLGTPNKQQLQAMKSKVGNFSYIPSHLKPSWPRKLIVDSAPQMMELLHQILQYKPNLRPSAYEACAHPFFDELRQCDMKTRKQFPPIFNLIEQERTAMDPKLEAKLKPLDHSSGNTL
jgi:serine/threonine protein kinase